MTRGQTLLRGSLLLLCTGCSDLYLMTREESRPPGGEWVYTGGGCASVIEGQSGFGGGTESSYFSLTTGNGEADLVVVENDELTIERHYGQGFLESGRKDTVRFWLGPERQTRMTLWGGPDCEEPEAVDDKAVERAFADDAAIDAGAGQP